MAQRGAMHRTVGAAVLVLTAPLALAACGGGDSDSGGSGGGAVTSLTVQDTFVTDPGKTYFGKLLDDCGQQNGVTINRTSVPGGDIIAKVLQQASSKTLPDILSIDNPDVGQLAAAGALAPLGDLGVTAEGISQGVVDANTFDGQLYGLQPTTQSLALFYNEDVLTAAGIQPPKTWDELKTAAAALKSGDRYGVAFSAPPTYEGTWQFLPFMWSNGGDETNIATPETAAALQLWVDLVSSGSASESVLNWGQEDVNDQFIAGNAAMMINGPWQFPVLAEHPDVHYGVVPLPAPTAGGTVVAPLGGATWTVPETGDADRQAKAAAVIQCVNSDQNMVDNALTNSSVPTKAELGTQVVAKDPRMQAFVDVVPDLRSRTAKLGEDWPKAATKIYTAVQTALTGGASPQEALEQAQNG